MAHEEKAMAAAGPITWFAQGTLYRLRPGSQGRLPVLYATSASGYARFTHMQLTDADLLTWSQLTVPERTARATRLLPP